MGWVPKTTLMFSPLFIIHLITLVLMYLITASHSQSIVKSLPGYHARLPFKFETGYVGVGEKEKVQLFYYFVESQGDPEEDPIMLYIPGGPGGSGLVSLSCELGPLSFNVDNGIENLTITSNPYSWTKMASIIFIDIPAGTGFAYAKTKEASISSDTIVVAQAKEFVKKFLINHPKFIKNPLYIMGMSYMGIVAPAVTLELYEGNERGDQPTLNIQGYILCSPLTDKFMDFNSRFEFAHRMALISDDIYKLGKESCDGNYVDIDATNSLCVHSLQRYEECTSQIYVANTLLPLCNESDPMPYCLEYFYNYLNIWANIELVHQALNIRQGTTEKWESSNSTLHYAQGKNDTFCYSYDIFSSFIYHKKLASKKCRALIFSGDHDFTFPYVGVEQWIASLNIRVEVPWKPFYVDGQVGGYEVSYAQNEFSLTYATVKGGGHVVPIFKPKESMELVKRWFGSRAYSSDS